MTVGYYPGFYSWLGDANWANGDIFKKKSNFTNTKYFEWEPNIRLMSKCLALRKLSNHILEQQLSNHFKCFMCMTD